MPKEQYMCQLCANHGHYNQPKKGHKRACPNRNCTCSLCSLNMKRRCLDQMERQWRLKSGVTNKPDGCDERGQEEAEKAGQGRLWAPKRRGGPGSAAEQAAHIHHRHQSPTSEFDEFLIQISQVEKFKAAMAREQQKQKHAFHSIELLLAGAVIIETRK